MWKNYLKVAIRNSIKDKYYIIINVLGLGVAMAFGLTVYLIHAYNLEFDNYFKDTDKIVRLHCLKPDAQGIQERFELAPIPLGPMAANELSGIENFTRFMVWSDNIKHEDQIFNQRIAYVDPDFFSFFDLKLKSGRQSDLKEKNNIYLTEELAKKYFGDTNPIGELITVFYGGKRSQEFKVAGVFNRIPLNSSFIFDALAPFDNFLYGQDIQKDDWTAWQQVSTFFKINSSESIDPLNKSIKKYVALQNEKREEWKVSDYQLIKFKNAKLLNWRAINGAQTNMRLGSEALLVFSTLAILILLIVSFNMANTSMALMARRMKEIGLRKAMGGRSSHIFIQFMFEMSWTSFLGLIVGIALYHWISLGFFAIWDLHYQTSDVSISGLVLAFIGLFVLVALFSGLSPALYSRKLQPTSIFQSQVKLKGTNMMSRILNALQFSISITLIIAGIVFTKNADFIKMLDIGYDKERLITIWTDTEAEFNGLKDKIAAQSAVANYAATNSHIGWNYEDSYLVLDTGKVEVRTLLIGRNYMETMGMHLVEGRLFNFDNQSDINENVIVNEAYVEKYQLHNPIGKMVNLEGNKKYIIGVYRNIIENVYRDYDPVPNIFLAANDESCKTLIVKAKPNKGEEVFAYLESSWKELVDDRPFTGKYQDELALGSALNDNNNLKTIFYYMAILGGLLSLTGIFALSSLNVSRRIKEIGIRKVLGASTKTIILLLNREFAITMLIAVILGSGFGVFLTNQILDIIYEYHISSGTIPIVISSIIVVILAFLTTSSTIYSAANTNPSETLRDQ